jgi:cytochrome b6-f complex iron-sulfur subunit
MPSNSCGGKCGECEKRHSAPGEDRRTFLSWVLTGGFFATMGSFLYPVVRFLNPPRITEVAVNEVDAGKPSELKPNSGKIVKFGSKPAILIRISDTEWRAFSAVCTHLNCTVQYRDTTQQIWCACHNGTYDRMTGHVVSGPPPNPLEEYAVNLRGDSVVISKKA